MSNGTTGFALSLTLRRVWRGGYEDEWTATGSGESMEAAFEELREGLRARASSMWRAAGETGDPPSPPTEEGGGAPPGGFSGKNRST